MKYTKRNMARILIIMVGIVFPPLFMGYVNWDIETVTRVGTWSGDGRILYAFASFVSIAFTTVIAFNEIKINLI